jgi:RimJ/RimL family protein N-acetyltransferase
MRFPLLGEASERIGFFELNPFPGCNQLVVSNHSFIEETHRGKGYGKAAHAKRLAMVKSLGYDAMICTVKADNEAQIKILTWFGWSKVFEFDNRETGHKVCVYMFKIADL